MMMANVLTAGIAVPLTVAIGIILIIIGAVYIFRRRMLLGAVLLIVGILLGGLNIFNVFD